MFTELICWAGPLLSEPAGALPLLAEPSESDEAIGQGAFLLAPFILAIIVAAVTYSAIYTRYRNPGERHRFEKEVEVAVGNLVRGDRKVGENNRQSYRYMSGSNEDTPLERVQRLRITEEALNSRTRPRRD